LALNLEVEMKPFEIALRSVQLWLHKYSTILSTLNIAIESKVTAIAHMKADGDGTAGETSTEIVQGEGGGGAQDPTTPIYGDSSRPVPTSDEAMAVDAPSGKVPDRISRASLEEAVSSAVDLVIELPEVRYAVGR